MATTSTFKVLLQAILEDLFADRSPVIATATGGTITSVKVSGQAFISRSPNAYDDVGIYVATDAGGSGAAPEGEFVRVRKQGFVPDTGTWLVSPVFTAAVASSDTVFFFYDGLDRLKVLNAVNRIITTVRWPRILPLSPGMTDGDMETSGVANWTTIGTLTTKEKAVTAANVLFGKQVLHLLNGAASSGVQSPSQNVTEQRSYVLSIGIQVISGTWTITPYDVTNSATITPTATCDQREYTEIRIPITIPSNCTQVAVRLTAANTAECYVNWVSPIPYDQELYTLPSQVDDLVDVEEILYLPQGTPTGDAYNYTLMTEALQPWTWEPGPRDWAGINAHRVAVAKSSYPLFVKFRSNEAALSANSDTTVADSTAVVEGALAELKQAMASGASAAGDAVRAGRLMQDAVRHARTYHAMRDSLNIARPRTSSYRIRRVSAPTNVG